MILASLSGTQYLCLRTIQNMALQVITGANIYTPIRTLNLLANVEELSVCLHTLGKQSLRRMAQNSKPIEEPLLHRAVYNTHSEYITVMDSYFAIRPPPEPGVAGEHPE